LVGVPTIPPHPSHWVISPFSCPQWALGISHNDLVSTVTKTPVDSVKERFHRHAHKHAEDSSCHHRELGRETGNDKPSLKPIDPEWRTSSVC
ncbi:hypothetical protein CRENBAI_003309, partial [Crenichthys baileyi]